MQQDTLMAAGSHKVFVDRASGKLEHRPALDARMERLRVGGSVTCGGWTGSGGRCAT